MIFLIEDDKGNKFGGFVSSKIDKIDYYISDSNAFVFSFESNGRLDEPMKFDATSEGEEYGIFKLGCQNSNYLFHKITLFR